MCHNRGKLFVSRLSLWNGWTLTSLLAHALNVLNHHPIRSEALRLLGPYVGRVESIAVTGVWEDVPQISPRTSFDPSRFSSSCQSYPGPPTPPFSAVRFSTGTSHRYES